ncbi:Gfo/Idh/MocA family oxidoreductase [Ramlibacter aurantiacus]|uniref:Gfo/Idh/MocA family oxidoreductase n=1 Tax=Ramlibacter aurantiacus TaxID=2801330 RepID=UPI00338E9CBC
MKSDSPVIRLGLIGLGGATNQMLPTLRSHPDVRIVAAADTHPDARDGFTAACGAPAYAEVEALCRDPRVNTVYVATPHQWHKEHALIAAACGKHIIVEKPMALSLEDCDAMMQAAHRHGVHLLIGHTHSFDAPVRRMREIIRSGELGPLAMINTWSYSNFLMRPRRPEELDTSLGGGIIYNQVPHQVDMVRLLGGGMVHSVRSMTWALEPGRPTEGSHLTFLQFEDGAAASLVFSGYDYFDSDEFHFWVGESGEQKAPDAHGKARAGLRRFADAREEGAFKARAAMAVGLGGAPQPASWHHPHCGVTIVSCAGGDMRPSADGVLVYDRQGRRELQVPRGPAFPDKASVLDEMAQAIRTARAPLHDGAWGMATMEVCAAVLQSARERREIVLRHQVPVRD